MLVVATWAQNAVVVYQADGNTATFAFSEKPVISYSGSDLVLTTTKTTVSYPVYLLKKIDFGESWEEATALDEVKAPDTRFSFQGGTLAISGGNAFSPVTLYTVGGTLVAHYRLDSAGSATIPVQSLGTGIYIVKTQRFTFKFRKP